ncbi:MAG TPA: transglutaminase family protein [Tenuifilaceae bacterium]|nr:transglutaminase family protein [Tenuifilaceae bacterium]
MRQKELIALISLLDDPDDKVYSVITEKLLQEGEKLIPSLEKALESADSAIIQQRIFSIIHQIQFQTTKQYLGNWVQSGANSLLEGSVFVARYRYPELSVSHIDECLEKMKQGVIAEINEKFTPLEKIKVLNHVFFVLLGFKGNSTNFYSPENHYINQLIETKKGGPVSLSILYSLVAHKLGLPIHCVSLPRNFILAYLGDSQTVENHANPEKTVHFYINPFNSGALLRRKDIEQFLTSNNLEINEEYFYPCSNRITITQLIASLMLSYQKIGLKENVDELKECIELVAGSSYTGDY